MRPAVRRSGGGPGRRAAARPATRGPPGPRSGRPGRPRARATIDDPAEPEELVLDLVEFTGAFRAQEHRGPAEPADRFLQIAGRRPGLSDREVDHREGLVADLAVQQTTGDVRPGVGGQRVLGQGAAQRTSRSKRSATDSSSVPMRPGQPVERLGHLQQLGRSRSATRDSRCAASALQIGQEPLDRAVLPGLVLQRLTDDLAGQLDGGPAEVGPQLGDDLRPLRVQLGATGRGDPFGFGVRLRQHVVPDGLRLRPGVLADLRRLLAGTGQLLVVLLQRRRRVVLCLLRLGDAALDGLGALGVGLLEHRPGELAQHDEQDHESDGRDEDLAPGQADRVGASPSTAATAMLIICNPRLRASGDR